MPIYTDLKSPFSITSLIIGFATFMGMAKPSPSPTWVPIFTVLIPTTSPLLLTKGHRYFPC